MAGSSQSDGPVLTGRHLTHSARAALIVFGESDYDRDVMWELVRGLRPDGSIALAYLPLRKPLSLVHGIDRLKQRARADRLLAQVKAVAAVRPVAAVVLHEDADQLEPAHEPLARAKEAPFHGTPFCAIGAVPAWETETWWLLFPEQVAGTRPSWRPCETTLVHRYAGKDVGQVANAKQALKHALGGRYEESDSADIARAIVASGHIHQPRGRSSSWRRFVDKVQQIPLPGK